MTQILKTMVVVLLTVVSSTVPLSAQQVDFLGESNSFVRFDSGKKYILLPIEEKANMCNLRLLVNNEVVKTLNVRLAIDSIDYFVPLELDKVKGSEALLDVQINRSERHAKNIAEYVCWKNMKCTDTFDVTNREDYRPLYHHTPPYGWMNDPNGMFFQNGVYHLYYQHNPYGSQWENMHWGHSTSRDLVHWEHHPVALAPDALGTIFSGSAVVDSFNTAGFGKGAIVAMYTSSGRNQTQSIAYSTDGGATFTKYEHNPVIVSNFRDFRDPKLIWHEPSHRWIVVVTAGQEVRFYSSPNLKNWTYESSFGIDYGAHGSVWECPELMLLPVDGGKEKKWTLVVSMGDYGPFGRNAMQYFTGSFDGHRFTCDSSPKTVKWVDYGKDNYAGVTFSGAPDGRHIFMGWMTCFDYADELPMRQYRGANTLPRDLSLYSYEGETYLAQIPVKETTQIRSRAIVKASKARNIVFENANGANEVIVELEKAAPFEITLSNPEGENVKVLYDSGNRTLSVNRAQSTAMHLGEAYNKVLTAPVRGNVETLRLFIDKSSMEVFTTDGRSVLTCLLFPSKPFNRIGVSGKAKTKTTVYVLGK